LVYEVDGFVKEWQGAGMAEAVYGTGEGWVSKVSDLEVPYRVAAVDFQPAMEDAIRQFGPLEAVRIVTATMQEQLAVQAKPKAKLAMAVMRGLLAREEMKQQEGGSYSAEETRMLLGISKAAVLKRYQKGQLLGWREAGQGAVRFPAWQFSGGNVLPGLPAVLAELATAPWADDWSKIVFFLSGRASLGGRRPLDLLRDGETGRVVQAARASIE